MRLNLSMISAVVIDYDRTLTDENLNLSIKALEALIRLKGMRGWRIIIASGRPLSFFISHNEIIELVDAIVAENGAVIYLPKDSKKIIIRFDDLSKIKERLLKFNIPIETFDVIISVKREVEELIKKLINESGVDAKIEYNVDTVMIMPKIVNKLRGVQMALKLLNIKGGFIAFGDGENDAEVIDKANIGIAVANATEIVKAKADYITNKPYGCGVAEFIESYLL